ncbi:glycosyltransferase [Marinobacter salicampi]|uniref:glycosyltransferase n=1 Tax=Marinobacter salicampi TaxID=435907 RepID=UPI00140C5E4E|nr:glycosyltransferase [Marinobacter salicampi]
MDRSRNKVVFVPQWNQQNPYQDCLASALEKKGFSVTLDNYPKHANVFSAIADKYPDAGVIHIHWIAPLFNRLFFSKNRFKSEARFLIYALNMVLDIRRAKRKGVKIVWTVHNLSNHESKNPRMELKFRRLLARNADVLCFHSKEAQELVYREYNLSARQPFAITQHACYQPSDPAGTWESATSREEYALGHDKFVFLFFGQIRKYKGVKQLIESFRTLEGSHVQLVIAGHIVPSEEEWITREAAKDPRIILKNRFLGDEELGRLINACDIVVLPYARTLSSGSALLAISYGKPLILPESGKVIGVPGERGAIYFGGSYTLTDAMDNASTADLQPQGAYNLALARELTWEKMTETLPLHYLGQMP